MGNSVINMIQIGGNKYNQSVSANHPLLCIFTYFKPATQITGNDNSTKKLQFIILLTAICIVSQIENSKNDKRLYYLEHLVRMSTCCLVISLY